MKPAIFILGPSAMPLATRLKAELNGEIHAAAGGDVTYAKAAAHLATLFRAGRPIIGLCASGILIRAVAGELADKHSEPPVIAVAEDGSSAVPLLGGHHGANDLARRIAALTSGHSAVTTASEIRFDQAFDVAPEGHVLANPENMKAATAARLAGKPVMIETTEQRRQGNDHHIVFHPKTLIVGLGAARGAPADEVIALITETLERHDLAAQSIAGFASIDLKSDEAGLHAAARHFGATLTFFAADELNAEAHRIPNPSDIVAREVGTPGVAEAAALAAAGPDATLIAEKAKGARVTCAIAKAPEPLLALPGQRQGLLHVVGIGPGTPDWRSPAAALALESASDWVGYGLYLDLVADLHVGQTEHRFPLGGEEDRVRAAIALAKEGKEVALVCSGDAGIYAMAALVYEVIDLEPSRIAVNVIPGISAFQAAAAKAGAMIGHDFCCISLSDLLTPWEVIEKRLHAAAQGDFVISFYNPRSLKRRDQLERAFAILKPHRKPQTPVVIASNLGRPEEQVKIVRFADFNPDDVDMLTLVMVGSSITTSFARGDGKTYAYTPRGYAKKRNQA